MMLRRNILTQLAEWKARTDRKPLILRGARQVGKTTAIDLFAKNFDNYIYLNLEHARDRNLFDEGMDVKELFQAILILKQIILNPGETLVFIDEIQNSPAAVKLLRFFHEEMSEIFVIGAGSLLEIVLETSEISFPVGRVEYLYMYPMSFGEFLMAKGGGPVLHAYNEIPIKKYAHPRLLSLFHEYVL
ncbi:MAG: AAA family ATPase, partial [Deltaproteobacteria bacterium]|nr:AAA family ATPase [Deltaproteobacteria bacterium]